MASISRRAIARSIVASAGKSTPARSLTTKKVSLPQDDVVLMDTTRQAMVFSLSKVQVAVAESLVPWFTTQMPASYFRQVKHADQVRHMRSLSAQFDPNKNDFVKSGSGRVVLQSTNDEGNLEVTYMDFSGREGGQLAAQMAELDAGPDVGLLSRVKVFVSMDNKLSFNIFTFEKEHKAKPAASGALPASAKNIAAYAAELKACADSKKAHADPGIAWDPCFSNENIATHVARCSDAYVKYTGPRSFLQQMKLFESIKATEDVAILCEAADLKISTTGLLGSGKARSSEGVTLGAETGEAIQILDGDSHWIKMAISNSVPLSAMRKITGLLTQRGVNIERLHLDHLDVGGKNFKGRPNLDTVTMVRMLVEEPKGTAEGDGKWLAELTRDIKRLKWVDDRTLNLAYRTVNGAEVGIQRAEVVTCLSTSLHAMLAKQDAWAFSKTNINAVVANPRYLRHAVGIADLFMARFDPASPLPDGKYAAWLQTLRDEVEQGVQEDIVAKEVLLRMIQVLDATRRTNLFLEDRYALSLRLSNGLFTPGKMEKPYKNDATADVSAVPQAGATPYGVFYVHGRRFNGFHVRFRDIARGGMRLVTPNSVEQLAIEAARHYDEAHGLATAQQAKNKDIPEGGSKCVVLIDTCSLPESMGKQGKDLVLRKSVKAFTDSMLDLIVDTPLTRANVVDKLGKQELVYLGPDEQVIPDDIEWITKRAAERGYPCPTAFMSSKPDAGINHKTYGVTSEGVQVFLDVALKEMGLHPAQNPSGHFTVKMTGGTDGDVAGNMIKILHREYGKQVRVVGLADATGSAEDPDGLNIDELVRLVDASLPVGAFAKAKLGAKGVLHLCDPAAHGGNAAKAEEALRARNTMHNRVVADAFIPAGGRPATIHEGNWRNYLQANGQPSSKLIVEGANLFLTPAARAAMHAATGIPIVKDSSANKCGVICSSYEIISSMLLNEKEFMAIKPELVKDVVAKLRVLAKREAELLFREFRSGPGSLPGFSARISDAINVLTDEIAAVLDEKTGGDYTEVMHLVVEHMPAKLASVATDRLTTKIPKEYLKRTIASVLASKMVYQEGIQFIEMQSTAQLGNLAFDYLKAEKKVKAVLKDMQGQKWDNPETGELASSIVRDGGVRAYIRRHGSAIEK